jgi:MFS family permease
MLISKLGNVSISIAIVLIIIALVIDSSIVSIVTSSGGLSSSGSNIGLFAFMIGVFAVGQYVILGFIKYNYIKKQKIGVVRSDLSFLVKSVGIIQYVLIAILVSTILQMVLTTSYHIIVIRAIISVSYGSSIILLAMLTRRFFSWFKSNHNLVVLMYALASAMISINALVTIIYTNFQFNNESNIIEPERSLTGSFTQPDVTFSSLYVITSVLSFIITWVATVFLLRHYSRKLGRIKYWVTVSIPLAYFLSQFQPLFLFTFSDWRLFRPGFIWHNLQYGLRNK